MLPGDGRVVSNFIVQALSGEDITIYGDGLQTRSFCYVDELVDGLVRLMESAPGVTGPINLGNPQEFTIAELARLVIELSRSRSRIVHRPLPSDDPRQRRPDITRARHLLDWQPVIRLREGLLRTITYFEERLTERPQRLRVVGNNTTPRRPPVDAVGSGGALAASASLHAAGLIVAARARGGGRERTRGRAARLAVP